MKLHSANAAILQPNGCDALQFTPSSITIAPYQAPQITDAVAYGNGLDAGNFGEKLETFIRHTSSVARDK
jgi:hypothetical protein